MDRTALVTRAQSRFQDPSAAIYTAAEWADYINDAYMDVVTAHERWPFLEARAQVTMASGDEEAILPFDVWKVTAVHNETDDYPLRPLDGLSEYRHLFPNPADSLGTPQYYRLRNNRLEVYPRPNQSTVIQVDVVSPPPVLGSTDEPVFPEHYHRILVSGALSYAYEDDGNVEQSAVHRAAFDRLLGRMQADLLGPRTEKYPEILDTF